MKKIGKYVSWILIFALGIGLGILTSADLDAMLESGMPDVVYFASIYLTVLAICYLNVIVHEVGHLLFGLLTGYQFSSFRILSFMWMRDERGKLCMKRYKLKGTGGQCLMEPPELVDGRMPTVLYNMGGSILNLAISAVCVGIWFVLAKGLEYRGVVTLFVMGFAVYGVYMALANGIPLHLGMIDNDGMNALNLRKNPKAMRAFWIELKYMSMLTQGKGIMDMPEEWSQLPTDAEMQNSHVAWLSGLSVDRLIVEHRFEEAIALLDHLLSADIALIRLTRCSLIYERIFCECMCGRDPETLEALRTHKQLKYMKAMKSHPGVIRTEYAYARLVERDPDKSSKLETQFEQAAKKYPYAGFLKHDRELMQLVKEKEIL